MALWSVDVQKAGYGEYWTNRYIVEAELLSDAVAWGQAISDLERAIHLASVVIERYRVSSVVKGDDVYQIVPVEQAGQVTVTASPLPLFNVVRVDFGAVVGRPSRKYLRGCLTEANTDQMNVDSATRGAIYTNYAELLAGAPWFVDVDGQPIVNATVKSAIAMRQLRRGSKRKAAPIIPPA